MYKSSLVPHSLPQVRAETQMASRTLHTLHLCSHPCCTPLPAWPQDRWLAQAWSGTTAAWCTPGSQGHPARLTARKNVISRHFMDKKRGAGSEAISGQASWSFRGNRVRGTGPLPIHLVQEWGRIASNGHGGALDHGAGGGPWGQPLFLFPSLCLLFL